MFARVQETTVSTAVKVGIARITGVPSRDVLAREQTGVLSTVVAADHNIGHNTIENTLVCGVGQ